MSRLPRRTFLKLSGAFIASNCGLRIADCGLQAGAMAACLPVPWPHQRFTEAAGLLSTDLSPFNLLLAPAHLACELIQRGRVQELPGPPGRAHDPAGAFTRPYQYAISALRGAASLAAFWELPGLWPLDAELVIGAALLRRGWPLNETHPGRLALVEADLLRRRPRLRADPQAAAAPAALALMPLDLPAGWRLALEGGALLEYDWLIPRGAPDPQAARRFVETIPLPAAPVLPVPGPGRHLPVMPLPPAARAQRARLWTRLTQN